MNTTKVTSVFDSTQMQKYFLVLTMKAQEVVYNYLPSDIRDEVSMGDFLANIKENDDLKTLIQDVILYALGKNDWEECMYNALSKNYQTLEIY